MRREGRLHGAHVRVRKNEEGYGEKASPKPTNHSKISARCPRNTVRCPICVGGLPGKKSIGKVKASLKARDLDVTRNHKMHEWSFSQKHRWGNHHAGDDYYGSDHCDENDEEQPSWNDDDDDSVEGFGQDESAARSPEMVCPIEWLVQMRRKSQQQRRSGGELQSLSSSPDNDHDPFLHSSLIDIEMDDHWCDLDFSEDEEDDMMMHADTEDWVFVMTDMD